MSSLIPEIGWTEFVNIVKKGKIEDLKSCQVNFNGLHIFTAIIPHGDEFSKDFIMTQSEYLAQKSNISGGKDKDEILETVSV